MEKIKQPSLDRLFETVLKLETVEECYSFFEDLCTIRELKDLSQRLEVACLLAEGLNYHEIAEQTGVSSTTISRVKRCLDYGSGGYTCAISRMEKKE